MTQGARRGKHTQIVANEIHPLCPTGEILIIHNVIFVLVSLRNTSLHFLRLLRQTHPPQQLHRAGAHPPPTIRRHSHDPPFTIPSTHSPPFTSRPHHPPTLPLPSTFHPPHRPFLFPLLPLPHPKHDFIHHIQIPLHHLPLPSQLLHPHILAIQPSTPQHQSLIPQLPFLLLLNITITLFVFPNRNLLEPVPDLNLDERVSDG